MNFAELKLSPNILKSISVCGYTEPTPIQEKAIPVVLSGRDLIATAQTGTGKTAAFVLPALQKLSIKSSVVGKGPRVLVLVPTRELAGQVLDSAKSYGRSVKFRCGSILGGMKYQDQLRMLASPVDLIVATPGRLVDLLERRSLTLERLEILVLDEADRMLDMGFSEDMEKIVSMTPANRQTLLFTATFEGDVVKMAEKILVNPERVELAVRTESHSLIEQHLHVADNLRHKRELLDHLVRDAELTRAIIFSATKRDADELSRELTNSGFKASPLHGDMRQAHRNKTIERMRRGQIRLLVATDVAARGLDVNGISHVINFDLPKFAEDYVHRIGRTGRAGVKGVAVSFVSPSERSYLERIERFIGKKLPEKMIEGLEPSTTLRKPKAKSAKPKSREFSPAHNSLKDGVGVGRPKAEKKGYGKRKSSVAPPKKRPPLRQP